MELSRLEQVEAIKDMLIEHATGGRADGVQYRALRTSVIGDRHVRGKLPACVISCRSLEEFWGLIKQKFKTYQERRDFLRQEFHDLLTELETGGSLVSQNADAVLANPDYAEVQSAWGKATARVHAGDLEGAITASRSMVETLCKLVLEDEGLSYPPDADLPKLYHLMSESLKLAPAQHAEDAFKRILGACATIVQQLGTIRNKLGDAHGAPRHGPKPAKRHAELVVNLAGAMASFLVQTWEARKSGS